MHSPNGTGYTGWQSMKTRWIRGLLIALVAMAGIATFAALMMTRARLGRRPRPATAPLVKVIEARPTSVPMVVHSMGGVRAAREVRLLTQVAGKVVHVSRHLIPGGRVKRGELLVRIERSDYDLAVRAARAAVAEAKLALNVQLGHRAVARTELGLLKDKLALTREGQRLASRESHVENARVQLDAAKSRLEQALLARAHRAAVALRGPGQRQERRRRAGRLDADGPGDPRRQRRGLDRGHAPGGSASLDRRPGP